MVIVPESVRMHFHNLSHLFLRQPGIVLFQYDVVEQARAKGWGEPTA